MSDSLTLRNLAGDYAPSRSNIFQMDNRLYFRNSAGATFAIAGAGINEVIVVELDTVMSVAIPYRLYSRLPYTENRFPHVDIFDTDGNLCFTSVRATDTQINVYFGIPFTGVVVVRV